MERLLDLPYARPDYVKTWESAAGLAPHDIAAAFWYWSR
jgi:hypothetical protein